MTYSDLINIKPLLGFTLNENSLPTYENAGFIQEHAYRMINGQIGVQTPDENLKAVETELVIAQILAIHSGRPFPMRLTQEHKIILDDYLDEELVSLQEFNYEYD